MKRPRAAKKATARRRPAAHRSKSAPPKLAPVSLDSQGVAYVNKLAAAIRDVMDAQGRWIPEIDAVSRDQALIHNPEWRSRITGALSQLISAADELRIRPLPSNMEAVDGALGEAQQAARSAGQGFSAAVDTADLRTMIDSLQHVDRMNQLIQRARALLSA